MTLLALLLLACPKPVDTAPPAAGTPILPAPEGEVYTLGPSLPRDPLVAWLVAPPAPGPKEPAPEPLPYDEVLSGAAAAVGLAWFDQGRQVDLAAVRWAAFLAGWPYPLTGYSLEGVAEGGLPEGLLDLRRGADPHERLGLARVRGPSGEVWVALHSVVHLPVQPFSRDQAPGATLALAPADPASGWTLQQRALSPSLALHAGPVRLDEPGEWVVELRGRSPEGADHLLLRAPVYVGEPTPLDAPLPGTLPPPADPGEAVRQALTALDELRGLVAAPTLTTEPVLAAVARKEAERLAGGGGPSTDREARLHAAGFPEGPTGEVTCEARTVIECLDGLFWAIDTRAVVLDARYDAVGVGAAPAGDRTRLVLAFARR